MKRFKVTGFVSMRAQVDAESREQAEEIVLAKLAAASSVVNANLRLVDADIRSGGAAVSDRGNNGQA